MNKYNTNNVINKHLFFEVNKLFLTTQETQKKKNNIAFYIKLLMKGMIDCIFQHQLIILIKLTKYCYTYNSIWS